MLWLVLPYVLVPFLFWIFVLHGRAFLVKKHTRIISLSLWGLLFFIATHRTILGPQDLILTTLILCSRGLFIIKISSCIYYDFSSFTFFPRDHMAILGLTDTFLDDLFRITLLLQLLGTILSLFDESSSVLRHIHFKISPLLCFPCVVAFFFSS